MGKLTVTIENHEYNVHIGEDSYQLFTTDYIELLNSVDRVAIIADAHVAELHLPELLEALSLTGRDNIPVKLVPSGESCKTPSVYIDCQ